MSKNYGQGYFNNILKRINHTSKYSPIERGSYVTNSQRPNNPSNDVFELLSSSKFAQMLTNINNDQSNISGIFQHDDIFSTVSSIVHSDFELDDKSEYNAFGEGTPKRGSNFYNSFNSTLPNSKQDFFPVPIHDYQNNDFNPGGYFRSFESLTASVDNAESLNNFNRSIETSSSDFHFSNDLQQSLDYAVKTVVAMPTAKKTTDIGIEAFQYVNDYVDTHDAVKSDHKEAQIVSPLDSMIRKRKKKLKMQSIIAEAIDNGLITINQIKAALEKYRKARSINNQIVISPDFKQDASPNAIKSGSSDVSTVKPPLVASKVAPGSGLAPKLTSAAKKPVPKPPGGKAVPKSPLKKAPPPKKSAVATPKAKSKFRRIPWEPVYDPSIQSFTSAESLVNFPIEEELLLSSFGLENLQKSTAEKEKDSQPKAAKKTHIILFTNTKRHYNMNLATSRLCKDGYDVLRNAIATLDNNFLQFDNASTILNNLPEPDEMKAVLEYVQKGGDITACDRPEQYTYALRGFTDIVPRMEAYLLGITFENEYNELLPLIDMFCESCKLISTSKMLRVFLTVLKILGNELNQSNVAGFRLSSIKTMLEYKTNSNRPMNLIEYTVVKMFENNYESDLLFFEELRPLVSTIKKVTLSALNERVSNLYKSLNDCKKAILKASLAVANELLSDLPESPFTVIREKYVIFLDQAIAKIKNFSERIKDAEDMFTTTARLFGETDQTLKQTVPEAYFNNVVLLCRTVEKCYFDYKNKSAKKLRAEILTQQKPNQVKPKMRGADNLLDRNDLIR